MRLPLPFHTLTVLAHFWGTNHVELVLVEPVLDWLDENDIDFEIDYKVLNQDVDYYIVFKHDAEAFAFKIRWA